MMGWGSVAEEWKEVLKRLQSSDPRTPAGLSRANSTPSKSDSVALGCSHYKPQVSLEKTLYLLLSILCSWQLGKESETKVAGKVKFSINWCE